MDEKQRDLLITILQQNESAFQWDANEIGRTHLVEHCIPTGNNNPIQQRQYPIPSVARENMNSQVNEMLKKNFIRPSVSPWRSPVLLVKKKMTDGSIGFRFCIDLKKVNSVTLKDSYSLPRISDSVDALCGAEYFTKLDVDRAFWQVGLREEDKCETAFIMDGNLFEFNVMTLRRSVRLAKAAGSAAVVSNEAGLENDNFSDTIDSLSSSQQVNNKGKPMLPCLRCKRFFEATTGLRIHNLYCKEVILDEIFFST